MRSAVTLLATAVAVATLAGCTVGPDYEKPQQVANVALADYVAAPALQTWWTEFADPALSALIATAIKQNRDLQQAAANVAKANAAFRQAGANRWPDGDLSSSYQVSENATLFAADDNVINRSYTNGLSLSWNADLAGGLKRAQEAASAQAQQATMLWQDAKLQIISQVAASYGDYRGAQRRLFYAEMNRNFLQQSMDVIQAQIEAGSATEFEKAQLEVQMRQVETQIPAIRVSQKTAHNTLAALLGQTAESLTIGGGAGIPALQTPVKIDDSINYLQYRPDVASAERNLAAMTAQQGVATAELYPDVSVSGFLGFLSSPSLALNSASQSWNVTPSIRLLPLNLAAVNTRIDMAEADTAIALSQFEQTVVEAANNMQLSFDTYGLTREQLVSAQSQFEASERAAKIARARYRSGTTDFLQLLDSERELLDSRDQLAVVEVAHFQRLVGVYRAFSGALQTESELQASAR